MVGAMVTLVPSLWTVILGLTICSSCAFVSQSAATGFVSDIGGEDRASALGLYLCCYYLGGSAGAAVPGLFWRVGGWPGTVALLAVVQVGTLLLASRMRVPADGRPDGLKTVSNKPSEPGSTPGQLITFR
jgi:predicted MFS family arabinose efflux permease